MEEQVGPAPPPCMYTYVLYERSQALLSVAAPVDEVEQIACISQQAVTTMNEDDGNHLAQGRA